MAHLIDKDALVAEIERRMHLRDEGYKKYGCISDFIAYEELEYFHDEFLPTLEVKEVDLETEINDWYDTKASKEFENVFYGDIENCAKHFFELGLKARKGDNI